MARLDRRSSIAGFVKAGKKPNADLAGQVRINQQRGRKASDAVKEGDAVSLDTPENNLVAAATNLSNALNSFQIDVTRQIALDLGASTGGFTDCLLQRGAARVFAVDVGHGQPAWKLRNDPRVAVMEKTNGRDLKPGSFPQPFIPFDLIVIDCSFISLRRLLAPAVAALLKPFGKIVALVKPQFEAGKAEADKGEGVITDPKIHERVLGELRKFIVELGGTRWAGYVESPLLGPAGNKEFLASVKRQSDNIKRVGLIANPEKIWPAPGAPCSARPGGGGEDHCDRFKHRQPGGFFLRTLPDLTTLAKQSDLLIVFGGDGTMLSVRAQWQD